MPGSTKSRSSSAGSAPGSSVFIAVAYAVAAGSMRAIATARQRNVTTRLLGRAAGWFADAVTEAC
jgi:hypothetical protein